MAAKASDIPDGVKGWSWGAFLLSWIWAIGNKTWVGLLALIPYFGFIVAIILGIKGREWAWKNKQWESVEHFNRVQRKWSVWGFVILAGLFLFWGILAAVALPAYQDYVERAKRAHSMQVQQPDEESMEVAIEESTEEFGRDGASDEVASPVDADDSSSNGGQAYYESVTCEGVKVDLVVNHAGVEKPTLFVGDKYLQLEDGPNYSGPICAVFNGRAVAGFVEYAGNAYEKYRVVDLENYEVRELSHDQASSIGF